MNSTAYLSLGSNLGDRINNLVTAITHLKRFVKINNISSFYQTEPINVEKQEDFINIAIEVSTRLTPSDFLIHTQKIEILMGRETCQVGRPRVIDIDIIFFNSMVYNRLGLQIPHPRAHQRAFVIIPIMELNPQLIHPVLNKSMGEISKNLLDQRIIKLDDIDIEKIK